MTTPPDLPTDALPLLCALGHAQEMPPENTCSDAPAPSRWLAHVKYAFSFGGPLYGASTIVEFRPPGLFNSDLINTIFPEPVARGQELLVRVIEDFLMRKTLECLTFFGREDVLTGPWIELPINKLYGLWVTIDWAGGTIHVRGREFCNVHVVGAFLPESTAPSSPRSNRGREPEYDWHAFSQEAIDVLEDEGLPTRTNEKG